MKTMFVHFFINQFQKQNPNMNDEIVSRLKFGLEGIYLTVTKFIVVLFFWFVFGIVKEGLLFLFFYSIIRFFAFGAHAKKSLECFLVSTITFVGMPFLSINITLSLSFWILINVLSITLIILYAPADTHKRPLEKKKRLVLKQMSLLASIILISFSFFFRNYILSNIIVFSLFTESLFITPLFYKLLNVPYSNYKNIG